jgi:hypothetical protein
MRTPHRRTLVAALALTLSVAACGEDEATPAPPGFAPLEVSTATRPTATTGQRCPEAFNVVTGERDVFNPETQAREQYEFAHGRGCIHGTVAAVWAAVRDPAVTVDRRRVSEFTVTRDVEPQYPVSFLVHHVVRDVVTIMFDHTWRAGDLEGTTEEPRVFAARYQKTFGSSFISLLRGSIVARPLDGETVEVEIIRHIKSSGSGADDARVYLNDCFNSLTARVHGRPLPSY